jgi:hypothetical protein
MAGMQLVYNYFLARGIRSAVLNAGKTGVIEKKFL